MYLNLALHSIRLPVADGLRKPPQLQSVCGASINFEMMQAFRCQHFYVTALTTGLFLVSFHYSTNVGIKSTVSHKDSDRHQLVVESHHQPEWAKANYPWIGDPYCQHLPVQVCVRPDILQFNHFNLICVWIQFAKNKTRPKWALTSFPGSGVTWTRQLIEGATG